jgi:hypothetical protein
MGDKIELIKKYYDFSDDKANQVVDLFSDSQLESIKANII